MAQAPLLQLTDVSITFGGDPVFPELSLTLQNADRLALVGRNGSGKSKMMKVMAGLVEVDRGTRVVSPGDSVGYMSQDPDMSKFATLGEFATQTLGESELWRVQAVAESLKFDPEAPVTSASGGERRRAALAKLIAEAPDLMLLDEPTNHLDIEAIQWLENHLKQSKSAFIVISHDRAFLRALTTGTLWIDRGEVRRQDKGFEAFEAWRDKTWAEEDEARHKLNRKIKAEARWAVEGISARRKRNQGRLRALAALKTERSNMIRRQGTAALELASGPASGKKVIEAKGVSKSFDDKIICNDFSLRIHRKDRVAFVGPNGVGKTTLIEVLIGKTMPDAGSVTLGTGLEIAVFDQRRAALDPDATLWESLTGDPTMRVSGRADQVMVRGTPRHVVGYLKDFLFDEAQARAPVRSLSGGEKARLLLARIMAQPSNVLVLDEPTNDLDVETLDLLQEVLDDYDGTVLLVSHDRDFLDRVATTTIGLQGNGKIIVDAGGWTDYQRNLEVVTETTSKPKAKPKSEKAATRTKTATGLTFTEKHRLEA
ncbi:MAG: ABC-F family ATP-binding cassette domain-containing protein, partial [Boseongicola sp.]|nr:ABC-F family ATP-binding cassette domain-containing protein [Boseongicola sp.]